MTNKLTHSRLTHFKQSFQHSTIPFHHFTKVIHYHYLTFLMIRNSPYFPAFGLNTERYSVSLHIQSKCVKIPEKLRIWTLFTQCLRLFPVATVKKRRENIPITSLSLISIFFSIYYNFQLSRLLITSKNLLFFLSVLCILGAFHLEAFHR